MKKMEADVVVVGGGMSGLTAAAAAAEKGASVIVFEKGETTGGAANMGMGFFAVGTKQQRDQMYNYTVDDAFNEFMDYTHWRPDARLVRKLFDQSASTVSWIESMGVEFLGAFKYFLKSRCTWHVVKVPGSNKPTERCASIMVKAMTDYAVEHGVSFQFKTPATKLITKDGHIIGVEAKTEDGESVEVSCDAVVVTTGGIGDNPEMIKEYLGFEWGKDLYTFRIPGLKGDGMKMCWAAGGGKTPVTMEITYNTPGTTDIYKTLSETMRQPNLMVNLHGKRIMNEEEMMNTTFTGNVLLRQPNRCGFTIINDEILSYYRKHGLDFITYHHGIKDVDKWDSELEKYTSGEGIEASGLSLLHKDNERSEVNMWVCNSIDEISEKTGIELEQLKKTLDEYNTMCDGHDTFFNKPSPYMKAIRGGRYYVARHFPGGYGSLGGIKVNDNLQVVTQEDNPIPGLYASGTDACSIFSDSYCFIMPGSTMGFAINSGRMAGYNAAAYLDSDDFIE